MPAANSVRAELARRLREVPSRAGVYFFRDADAAIIYIGKSVRLRDRVRSYFSGKPETRKLRRLRREIRGIDWQETGSELEALLLESRLVKQHLPRYNTILREFRAAPYVRVDWNDPYPRLEVTRAPGSDGAEYLGPFRNRDALEAAVSALSDALQLRTCAGPGDALPGTRPCYRAELGACAAPCAQAVGLEEYRRAVAGAADVFAGRGSSPLRVLEETMERAAEGLRFEQAARLRDAIESIRAAGGRQQALRSAIRRLNLLAACPSVRDDSVSLFLFAAGRLVFQRDVTRAALASVASVRELAREIAATRAACPPPADRARLSAAALDEIQIVSAWMRQKTREGVTLDLPAKELPEEVEARIRAWLAEMCRGQS